MKKGFVLMIAGVCVVALVVAIILTSPWSARPSDEVDEPSPRELTFERMKQASPNAIFVEDQTSGANFVLVKRVISEISGQILIHADDGGVPGVVVSESYLFPIGGAEDVIVTLKEPLLDQGIYYAIMADTNGKFMTDTDGNVIVMSFVALP